MTAHDTRMDSHLKRKMFRRVHVIIFIFISSPLPNGLIFSPLSHLISICISGFVFIWLIFHVHFVHFALAVGNEPIGLSKLSGIKDENQSTYFILGSKLILICWHCLWAKEKIVKYNFHVNYYHWRQAMAIMLNVQCQHSARYSNIQHKKRLFALASILNRLLLLLLMFIGHFIFRVLFLWFLIRYNRRFVSFNAVNHNVQ